SWRRPRKKLRTLAAKPRSLDSRRVLMILFSFPAAIFISRSGFSFPFQPQHAANHAGNSLPVLRFQVELLLAAFCDGIKLRFAIVLRCAPLRRHPAMLLQSPQRGVHRPFIELADRAPERRN